VFPPRAIPHLADARGAKWRELVKRVAELPDLHDDHLAFMFLMARLNECLFCNADYYYSRADVYSDSCIECSLATLRLCRLSEDELIQEFELTKLDLHVFTRPPDKVI
jgi:hypothetical protein